MEPSGVNFTLIFLFIFSLFSRSQNDDFSFYPYKDLNGWGLKYSSGEKLFEEKFDSIAVIDKARIRVKIGDHWGIIDSLGNELVPARYARISHDLFGYHAYNNFSNDKVEGGFLSFEGDTLVPFGEYLISSRGIGKKDDFLLLVSKFDDKQAIFSSDGIQRTGFEFTGVRGIDSVRLMKSPEYNPFFFGLESANKKYGIYDGVNKRIVVDPIYDDVCISNCGLAENPHLQEGPIYYTGTKPVFLMKKDNKPFLIKENGEILFNSDSITKAENNTSYYISNEGKLSRIEGVCMEKRDAPPPYVMKNEKGFYLVNKDGSFFQEDEVYHDSIVKNSCSNNKDKLYYYKIIDSDRVGLMDSSGYWMLEQEYVNINCFTKNDAMYFEIESKNGDYQYFDQHFKKMIYNPKKHSPLPRVFKKDSLFGVLGQDSSWIIPPEFSNVKVLNRFLTNEKKGYIFEKNDGYLYLYDGYFNYMERFQANDYRNIDGSCPDNDQYICKSRYLFLYNDSHLSFYDRLTQKWILEKEIMQLWNPGEKAFMQYLKSENFFFLKDFSNQFYVIDINGETIFKTPISESFRVEPKIIDYSNHFILKMKFFDEENKLVKVRFQNRNGDILNVNEGNESDKFYLRYHQNSETFFLQPIYERMNYSSKVYNTNFTKMFETNDQIMLYDEFFVLRNKNKNVLKIYNTCDSIKLTIHSNYLAKTEYGSTLYTKIDSNYILLNSYTILSPFIYYSWRPVELGKSGLIMMQKEHLGLSTRCDVYHPSGQLILENYNYTKRSIPMQRTRYFVFENENQEVWLNEDGVIYHRNIK